MFSNKLVEQSSQSDDSASRYRNWVCKSLLNGTLCKSNETSPCCHDSVVRGLCLLAGRRNSCCCSSVMLTHVRRSRSCQGVLALQRDARSCCCSDINGSCYTPYQGHAIGSRSLKQCTAQGAQSPAPSRASRPRYWQGPTPVLALHASSNRPCRKALASLAPLRQRRLRVVASFVTIAPVDQEIPPLMV